MKNKVIFILSLIIVIQSLLLFWLIKKERARLVPAAKPRITQKVKIEAPAAKVAIVLDDWGYNLNNLDKLREIEYPITLAILPNLAHSYEIAEEAHRLDKEIILHLPMEPYPDEKVRLEQDTIMSGMNQERIIGILNNGIENLSYAAGVSNHMGSKLTQDEKAIKIIFEELKKKGLFFLDSLTAKSICKTVAKNIGVKFIARSVFLDNISDEAYINKQIRLLVKQAKLKGAAIGIGHDRRLTLEVLKKVMPELEKREGVRFVFASELAY